MWYKVWSEFVFFAYGYLVVPAPSVEVTVLSSLNCLCALVKNHLWSILESVLFHLSFVCHYASTMLSYGEGSGTPLQYSCLEKSHGWRSLVGCSPWGREEPDTTEWLHFHFTLSCIGEGNGNPLQCSCLENPRDGEPVGLPSMWSHRVGHDWSDLAA